MGGPWPGAMASTLVEPRIVGFPTCQEAFHPSTTPRISLDGVPQDMPCAPCGRCSLDNPRHVGTVEGMTVRTRGETLEAKLVAMLADLFPGITVEVGRSKRWNRMCATFRWSGFAGLMPEERFQRLAKAIPEGFRESQMKGFVWLELAPEETLESFLKLPRSEDVTDQEPALYDELLGAGFFEALDEAMGVSPGESCRGDFSQVEVILSAEHFSKDKIRDAKLVFIRHGVYCDCQILETAQPALAELYADKA